MPKILYFNTCDSVFRVDDIAPHSIVCIRFVKCCSICSIEFIEISEVKSNIVKMLEISNKIPKAKYMCWAVGRMCVCLCMYGKTLDTETLRIYLHMSTSTNALFRRNRQREREMEHGEREPKKNLICNFKQMENKSNPNKCSTIQLRV